MSGFRFHVGNRGRSKVVVFDDGSCRPASDAEVEMWDALGALRAENEQLQEQLRLVSPRAAMLSAVHGALIDAGCTVGEIGRCEAGLVRELAALAEVLQGAWNTADAERTRLMGEVERLTRERDDDPSGNPEHVCQYRAEADAQCVLLAEIAAAVRELDAAMPKCAADRRYVQHRGHVRVQAAIDALVGLAGAIEKGGRG